MNFIGFSQDQKAKHRKSKRKWQMETEIFIDFKILITLIISSINKIKNINQFSILIEE
jgi:hypothetical protein